MNYPEDSLKALTRCKLKSLYNLDIKKNNEKSYFKEEIMKEVLEELVNDIHNFGLYIRPINIDSEFEIGYEIGDKRAKFLFSEDQLPKDYNFDKLWPIIQSKSNFENLKTAGLNPLKIVSGDRKKYLSKKVA